MVQIFPLTVGPGAFSVLDASLKSTFGRIQALVRKRKEAKVYDALRRDPVARDGSLSFLATGDRSVREWRPLSLCLMFCLRETFILLRSCHIVQPLLKAVFSGEGVVQIFFKSILNVYDRWQWFRFLYSRPTRLRLAPVLPSAFRFEALRMGGWGAKARTCEESNHEAPGAPSFSRSSCGLGWNAM